MTKVYIQNPFEYNFVALKKRAEKNVEYTPTIRHLTLLPGFVLIGNFLGIQSKTDFNEYGEKVLEIINWAKKKTQSEDVNVLIDCISNKLNYCHSVNAKRINDVLVAVRLENLTGKKYDYNGMEEKDDEDRA